MAPLCEKVNDSKYEKKDAQNLNIILTVSLDDNEHQRHIAQFILPIFLTKLGVQKMKTNKLTVNEGQKSVN